jgi:aryl-alcohol dehydrogenase-like predicted oxidoreductase
MEYTEIAGFRNVSRLGFGCWATGGHGWGNIDDHEAVAAVKCAFDRGITFYDTADVYGFGKSEERLCRALGKHRHNVTIATKFGVRWDDNGKTWKDISPSYMRKALEASLRRLKLECIPIYYVHWPDGKTDLTDILQVMTDCIQEGKIGAIGISNFSAEQIKEAVEIGPIHAYQTRLNLLERKAKYDTLPLCRANNIAFISWGSLADGLLTGKFLKESTFSDSDHRNRNPHFHGSQLLLNLKKVEKLKRLASARNVSTAQLALRWLLDTTGVSSVLVGAKSPIQIEENIGALDWSLTFGEYDQIDTLTIEDEPGITY